MRDASDVAQRTHAVARKRRAENRTALTQVVCTLVRERVSVLLGVSVLMLRGEPAPLMRVLRHVTCAHECRKRCYRRMWKHKRA
jgi:hypothetical protein